MKYVGNYAQLNCMEGFIRRRLLSAAVVFCICLLLAPNLYGGNRYDFRLQGTMRYLRNAVNPGRLHITPTYFDHTHPELIRWLQTDLVRSSNPRYYGLRHIIPDLRSVAMQSAGQWLCSDGWYVTGYYAPRENELPGTSEEVYVERQGNLSFSQKFLDETRTEGWGITRFGWALGHHSGGWHRSDAGPLDASGNLLTDGAIAIDRSLIPRGAQVQISTLPSPWGSKTLRATDVGVGIIGQHIDVFTGTGRTAEQETFRITSNDNRVCFHE